MSKNIDKKNLYSDLEKLGLSLKEAAVYTELLRLGRVGSTKIVRATGLHGQFVYDALASLEGKGLVSWVLQSNRKRFYANDPERLNALVQTQKSIAERVIASLSQIQNVFPQTFEVYQGPEAYVAHEFSMLDFAIENCIVYVIASKGDQFLSLLGPRYKEYEDRRIQKRVTIRYIGSSDQREVLTEQGNSRDLFEYRILKGPLTGLLNINAWPGMVGFNLFGDPVLAFAIKNEGVAEGYRTFCESLWEQALV